MLVNNIANIGAASLLTAITIELFGPSWVALSSAILTVVILIFAEVAPKQVAVSLDSQICLRSAAVVRLLEQIFFPVIAVSFWITANISQLFIRQKEAEKSGLDDLYHMVNLSAARGVLAPQEQDILHNVLQFSTISVKQFMTHRIDIFSLDENCLVAQAASLEQLQLYQHIPLYRQDPEKIIATVPSIAILKASCQHRGDVPLSELGQAALLIPEQLKIAQLYFLMSHHQREMVILIDEYGGLSGLITQGNLVNAVFTNFAELAGNQGFTPYKDGWLISGSLSLQHFVEYFHLPRSSEQQAATVGGYLLNFFESMPKEGQVITLTEGNYKVVEIKQNRISRIHFCPYHLTLPDGR